MSSTRLPVLDQLGLGIVDHRDERVILGDPDTVDVDVVAQPAPTMLSPVPVRGPAEQDMLGLDECTCLLVGRGSALPEPAVATLRGEDLGDRAQVVLVLWIWAGVQPTLVAPAGDLAVGGRDVDDAMDASTGQASSACRTPLGARRGIGLNSTRWSCSRGWPDSSASVERSIAPGCGGVPSWRRTTCNGTWLAEARRRRSEV